MNCATVCHHVECIMLQSYTSSWSQLFQFPVQHLVRSPGQGRRASQTNGPAGGIQQQIQLLDQPEEQDKPVFNNRFNF